MKSYNVKSNAKRFARGLVAKYPAFEPMEPVELSPGAREWYPAVKWLTPAVVGRIPEEVAAAAKVLPPDRWAGNIVDYVTLTGEGGPADANPEAEHGNDVTDMVGEATHPAGRDFTGANGRAALAELLSGSPAKRTAEEIAASRAERRKRIDAGEYAAKEEPKAKKTTAAETILAMLGEKDGEGAAAAAIAEALGWQAHTLRGYIGGTLRKRLAKDGLTIKNRRAAGEPTRYYITALE